MDLLTIGRVSIDLFSEQIGAPFEKIESFSTSVGGSPTNIAIGSAKLGARTAVLTGVGQDPSTSSGRDSVGDFVIRYLEKYQVDTRYVLTKEKTRTGMAVVGVEPPSDFPLTFYRENPADIFISLDDADTVDLTSFKAILVSGTALARGSMAEVTLYLAEKAQKENVQVWCDLDARPSEWQDFRAYAVWMRRLHPLLDIIIGTEEEFEGADLPAPMVSQTYVIKRGGDGVTIDYPVDGGRESVDVPPFTVEVVNTVGAGDSFASGLITSPIEWGELGRGGTSRQCVWSDYGDAKWVCGGFSDA